MMLSFLLRYYCKKLKNQVFKKMHLKFENNFHTDYLCLQYLETWTIKTGLLYFLQPALFF